MLTPIFRNQNLSLHRPVLVVSMDYSCPSHENRIMQLAKMYLIDSVTKKCRYQEIYLFSKPKDCASLDQDLGEIQAQVDVLHVSRYPTQETRASTANQLFAFVENMPEPPLENTSFANRHFTVGKKPPPFPKNVRVDFESGIFCTEPESWITHAFAKMGKVLKLGGVIKPIKQHSYSIVDWICFIARCIFKYGSNE